MFPIRNNLVRNGKRVGRGFTLIEAMVVIGVIGVLAILVMASLSLSRQRSQVSRAKGDLSQARSAIALLLADTGKWPNGCESEQISNPEVALNNSQAGLLQRPSIGNQGSGCVWTEEEVNGWNGPYIDRVLDPWSNPYYFDPDYWPYQNCSQKPNEANAPMVLSFGPNGAGLNVYDCDDIFLELH